MSRMSSAAAAALAGSVAAAAGSVGVVVVVAGSAAAVVAGSAADIIAMSAAAAMAHILDARLLMPADSYAPPLAGLEEPLQGGHVGRIGFEFQGVDAFGTKVVDHAFGAFQRQFVEARAHGGVGGVDFDDLAGFRIFQCEHADVGQFLLARIRD